MPKGRTAGPRLEKPCQGCGAKMTLVPSLEARKWCSRSCYVTARWATVRNMQRETSRTCAKCSEAFDVDPDKTYVNVYCSAECRKLGRREMQLGEERTCRTCGASFTANRYSTRATCSSACARARGGGSGISQAVISAAWKGDPFAKVTRLMVKQQYFDEQDGRCALCDDPLPSVQQSSLDHCHETGELRGLLHPSCNTGLGHFHDDIEKLLAAVAYLERTRP